MSSFHVESRMVFRIITQVVFILRTPRMIKIAQAQLFELHLQKLRLFCGIPYRRIARRRDEKARRPSVILYQVTDAI